MYRIFSKYAAELGIVNTNFSAAYPPDEIYNFSLRALRLAICNRIKNSDIVKMDQRDIDILTSTIMEINDIKMFIYREALIKYSEVLHYEF